MAASDKELGALSACVDHLESLPSQDARERVCEYLSARFRYSQTEKVASRFAPRVTSFDEDHTSKGRPLRGANTVGTKDENGKVTVL